MPPSESADRAGKADKAKLKQLRRMALARRLRALRADRDWSQDALCARAGGMDRSYYSELEAGKHSPSLDLLWLLADAYGIPVTDFFRDT